MGQFKNLKLENDNNVVSYVPMWKHLSKSATNISKNNHSRWRHSVAHDTVNDLSVK